MASKKKIENNENASVSNTTERITKKSIKQKKNERKKNTKIWIKCKISGLNNLIKKKKLLKKCK